MAGGADSSTPNIIPTGAGLGHWAQKLKILTNFKNQISKYKRIATAHRLYDFPKFSRTVGSFVADYVFKLGEIRLRVSGVTGVLMSGNPRLFSAHYRRNYVTDPNVLGLQKRARF